MYVLAVISWCLAFSFAAGNSLHISDIRLVNGSGPFGGRVEIQVNGVWGTVCDDSFDFNDATVMCRMMNLAASTYMTGAWYGQGKGPIFVREFNCTGYESHLNDCSYISNVQCTHARDIGIICSECPGIDITNGYAVDISADGTVLSAKCKNGFTSNATKSTCKNGIWSPPLINCSRVIIRLMNGKGVDGRVEVLFNGTWGTICSRFFSTSDAEAICNILFGTRYSKYWWSSSTYGPGTGPIHIHHLDCTGSETDINECSYSLDVSCTDHSHDVAVACIDQHLNITGTRLVNGTGPYDGRIELYADGHWGTICGRHIDKFDAQTICSTHNASLTVYFSKAMYGKGTGPVLIDDIDCYRHRDHINDCTLHSPYRPYCTHEYDLSIVCTPCGLPQIHNGEAFSFHNTELTVKCQEGFFPDYIKMRCSDNGTWVEIQRCIPYNAYPLNISQIRLRSSLNFSYEGRVEVFANGIWGTVCGTNFDSNDAAVLCRMLNLEYSIFFIVDEGSSELLSFIIKYKDFFINAAYFGRGSGTIFLSNLNCDGTEKHINNCTYETSNRCSHNDDVGVMCTGYQLNITDIRLAGTNGPYHGRVELEVNGTWGTICDKNMFSWEARVLCRMLGLEYYFIDKYGPGSGPIYLDRLDCPHSAAHINECKYGVNKYYNCDHGDDASVMCYGPRLNITDVRLVNGTGAFDGRAEIKVNDTWGTICDENFDILDADYFCRKLGLRAILFYTGAFYGEGSGSVFIDHLLCETYDYDLSYCKYLFLNECTHERDVSVVCNECGQEDISQWGAEFLTYSDKTLYADCSYYKTSLGTLKLTCNSDTKTWVTEGECQEYSYPLNITNIRLANGAAPSEGRVEIKSMNTWGTICDDNFAISEANLICRMVGYTRALSFHGSAFYGEGKGPIFVDDLACKDNAFDFNDCTYITQDDCSHGDDISVVCTGCGDATPKNGFVNTSSTTYQTVVYVTCEKGYKLIGEENIICQANWTWSNRPVCQRIDCGYATPKNGFVDTPSTTYQTVVHVTCDNGYKLIGEEYIICQPNATWSNRPVCKLIDCGYATPKNGFVNTSSTTNQTVVHVTCDNGYKLIGEEYIICQPNATWNSRPVCNPIDCGDATPENGFVNTSSTTYQSVVHVTCEKGYKLIGEDYITCQPNATWSNRPVCKHIEIAVNDDTKKVKVIIAVCMGFFVVAIIGIVVVAKVFGKRTSNSKTVQESTVDAGTEVETNHNKDNPPNMQQSSTESGSETNLGGSFREVGGRNDREVDGHKLRTYHNNDNNNPTNIQQTSTERGSETNLCEHFREVGGRSYREVDGQNNREVDGRKIRTHHNNDNPTNIQQTERGSETNLRDSIREVAGRKYREMDGKEIFMKQLDYDIPTPKEHDQKLDHHTMQTNETSFCENGLS